MNENNNNMIEMRPLEEETLEERKEEAIAGPLTNSSQPHNQSSKRPTLDEKDTPHQRFNPKSEAEALLQVIYLVNEIQYEVFLRRMYTLIREAKYPKLQVSGAYHMELAYHIFKTRLNSILTMPEELSIMSLRIVNEYVRRYQQESFALVLGGKPFENLDKISRTFFSKRFQLVRLEEKLGLGLEIAVNKVLLGDAFLQENRMRQKTNASLKQFAQGQFAAIDEMKIHDPVECLSDSIKQKIQSCIDAYSKVCEEVQIQSSREAGLVTSINRERDGKASSILTTLHSRYSSNVFSIEAISKALVEIDVGLRHKEIRDLCQALGCNSDPFLQAFNKNVEDYKKIVTLADPLLDTMQQQIGPSTEKPVEKLSREIVSQPADFVYDCLITLVRFAERCDLKSCDLYKKSIIDMYLHLYNKLTGENLTLIEIIARVEHHPLPSSESMVQAMEEHILAGLQSPQLDFSDEPLNLPPLEDLVPHKQDRQINLGMLGLKKRGYQDLLSSGTVEASKILASIHDPYDLLALMGVDKNIWGETDVQVITTNVSKFLNDFRYLFNFIAFIDIAQQIMGEINFQHFFSEPVSVKIQELLPDLNDLDQFAGFIKDVDKQKIENREVLKIVLKKAFENVRRHLTNISDLNAFIEDILPNLQNAHVRNTFLQVVTRDVLKLLHSTDDLVPLIVDVLPKIENAYTRRSILRKAIQEVPALLGNIDDLNDLNRLIGDGLPQFKSKQVRTRVLDETLTRGLELIPQTDNLDHLATFIDLALLEIAKMGGCQNDILEKARQRGMELVVSEIFENDSLTLEQRKELLGEYKERDIFKIRRNQAKISVGRFFGMQISTQKKFDKMIRDIDERIKQPERSHEMQPMQNPLP